MLSAFLSNGGKWQPEKAVFSGAAGGALSTVVDIAAPKWNAWARGGTKVGAGWLIARFTGMTHVGAGMAGAGAADLIQQAVGVSEGGGGQARWAKQMEALPTFMSETGRPLTEAQAMNMLQGGTANSVMPQYAQNFFNY